MRSVVALVTLGLFTLACSGSAGPKPPPTDAKEAGHYTCDGCSIYDVAVVGTTAYLADNKHGLVVVDVSDPANPKQLGTAGSGAPVSVAVQGTHAFVGDFARGLVVYDVSNPSAPSEVSVTALNDSSAYFAVPSADGKTVYCGAGVYDVSDPAHPTRNGTLPTPGGGNGAYLDGNKLYVAESNNGFSIVDVTDPANPKKLGNAPESYAKRVWASGNVAYVTDYNDQALYVYDVSDPAQPKQIQKVAVGGYPGGLAMIGGKYLAVAGGYQGAVLYDLATATSPSQWKQIKTDKSNSYELDASDDVLVVADQTGGLTVDRLDR